MFDFFKKKSFLNWFILAASTAVSSLISFLIFIFIGRKMSNDGYGQFNVITSLATTFATVINNIACGTVLNREIATHPFKCRDYIKKSFVIRVSSFIIGAISIAIYCSFKYSYSTLICLLTALFLSYDVFYEFFEQFAFGFKTVKFSSIINISSSIVLLLVFVFIPNNLCTIESVLIIYTSIYICKCVAYLLLDLSNFRKSEPGESTAFSKIVKDSLPYLWLRVVGILGTQLPVLLLADFSELSQVSFYSVGNKFTLPMTILVNTAISAFFPYFSQFYKTDKEKYGKYLYFMLFVGIQASSLFAVLLSSTCELWLPLIMTEKYNDAVYPFKIQVWYTCVLCVDLVVSMAFSSSFKQNALAIITTIDVAVLLPVLFLTIEYGAVGVAIGKASCAAVCLLYHIAIFMKLIPPKKFQIVFILTELLIMVGLMLVTIVFGEALIIILAAAFALALDFLIDIPYFRTLKEIRHG